MTRATAPSVPMVWRVAVPVPLRQVFDYLPASDADPPLPGTRVLVPFAGRRLVGVILQAPAPSALPAARLRRAVRVLESTPCLPEPIVQLCCWAADYYHAPLGEVLQSALPLALRSSRSPRGERSWVPTAAALGLGDDALARAPKQALALAELQRRGVLRRSELEPLQLDPSIMRTLVRRGLAQMREGETAAPLTVVTAAVPVRPDLNAQQQAAVTTILAARDGYQCLLLHGVTGSGKTEVYLHAIEAVLQAGRQALVLIPEIGLTPQARQRYEGRLGHGVAVIHSGLSVGDRLRAWQAAARGELRVLIGTRSAVFTPLPRLGLVIVDEEHDVSFKQQEGFRYSARDVAIYRARAADVPIVLGSATPSTESLANVDAGRFRLLELTHRAGAARPPHWRLIDIRHQPLQAGLSAAAIGAIGETLEQRQQVLVFLNRRGWSPVLMCHDCGWNADCEHCDARLTLHRDAHCLWCHHCDRRRRIPPICPRCHSRELVPLGQGTERCEHTLQRLFPRFPVRRVDRGSTQRREAMQALLDEVDRGEPMILVGTQMLAKGHDFPGVTLVVVLDADGGLFSAEYRAVERTMQLLEQVGGRAGRGARPGQVLVQTHQPGHPLLGELIEDGYRRVARRILAQRQAAGLPPFGHFALLWTDCRDPESGPALLRALRHELAGSGAEVIGPIPAPLHRRGGRFRDQLLLHARRRTDLHRTLTLACAKLEASKLPAHARWAVDVDPIEGV